MKIRIRLGSDNKYYAQYRRFFIWIYYSVGMIYGSYIPSFETASDAEEFIKAQISPPRKKFKTISMFEINKSHRHAELKNIL
jgi:hypothetical protein